MVGRMCWGEDGNSLGGGGAGMISVRWEPVRRVVWRVGGLVGIGKPCLLC